MSGIEILGIILAVVPIFIEGADKTQLYCRGIFRKERVLDGFKQGLDTQQSLLTLYIKGVLGATKLSPSLQNDLMSNLGGPLWQDDRIQAEIEAKLGDASKPFIAILHRVADVLLESLKKDDTLRLDPIAGPAKLKQLQNSKSAELADRIKFSWKQPSHNKILLEISSCNNELRNLKGAAEGAEQFQKRQNYRRVHSGFQTRQEAQRLYQVLSSACTCNPRTPHEANLRMRFCDETWDSTPHSHFDMLLLREHYDFCEVNIKVARESSFSKVSIQMPNEPASPEDWKALDDICHNIESAMSSRTKLEWAIDKEQKLRVIRSVPRSIQSANPPLLTLEACLKKFSRFAGKKRFLRERYILAVVLAHSLLQLHHTPWLAAKWNAQDITFPGQPEQLDPNSSNFGFMFRTPYIGSTLWTGDPNTTSHHYTLNQSSSLLQLAILLIEIHMNRSLEPDLAGASDARGPLLDLLQECYEDSNCNEEYRDAVAWLISPKPDPITRVISFDEPGFRELYFAEVMSRLEDALEQEFGIDQNFLKSL